MTSATINKEHTFDKLAAPIFHQGTNNTACLLIHGLTASPTEVKPVADYLIKHDPAMTVSAIRLPGHGTTPADLRRCRRTEWQQAVREGYNALADQCSSIHVVGVSMGAILAADLVLTGAKVETLVMLAPPFRVKSAAYWMVPVVKHLLPYKKKSTQSLENHRRKKLFSYDCYPLASLTEMWKLARNVQVRLKNIKTPTLIAVGHHDRYVPLKSIHELRQTIGPHHCSLIECPHSGHVLPHEPDAETLLPKIHRFMKRPIEPIDQQKDIAHQTE